MLTTVFYKKLMSIEPQSISIQYVIDEGPFVNFRSVSSYHKYIGEGYSHILLCFVILQKKNYVQWCWRSFSEKV